jgi:hypothetical protein
LWSMVVGFKAERPADGQRTTDDGRPSYPARIRT